MAAFASMLLLASLPAIKAILNTRAFLSWEGPIEDSYRVLADVDSIKSGIQQAHLAGLHYAASTRLESGQQERQRFDAAADLITSQLDDISWQTRNNSNQQQRLVRLRSILDQELDEERLVFRSQPIPTNSAVDTGQKLPEAQELIQEIRAEQTRLLEEQKSAASKYSHQMQISGYWGLATFVLIVIALFGLVMRESKRQRRAEQIASATRTELESSLVRLEKETENIKLFNELQQNFQICLVASEAHEIITNYLNRLFPEANGCLATINNSRNMMETVVSWGNDGNLKAQTFAPEDCCAMRGGRLYSYTRDLQGLACRHFAGEVPDAYVCLPLVALGETLGILHINSSDTSVLSSARLWPLQRIVEQAAMTLANLNLRAKLHEQSIRDPLTGLFNRRYLEIALEREVRRSVRKQTGVGIIMADGDKFKQFNDTFGHEAGDLVLKEIATVLRRSVRAEDIACRFGGEEFVIILSDCSADIVCKRAEVMRNAIAALNLEHGGRSLGKVTASFGVSFCQDGSLSPETLLRLADEALYQAKEAGRDRVVLSSSVRSQPVAPEEKLENTRVSGLAM